MLRPLGLRETLRSDPCPPFTHAPLSLCFLFLREACWLVEEDEKQVSYAPSQQVPNSGTFDIAKEDHTIGNLVRTQLLMDPEVRFAAYKLPHPLDHRVLIRIQVTRPPHTSSPGR